MTICIRQSNKKGVGMDLWLVEESTKNGVMDGHPLLRPDNY
jgi:hypothetical protein